MPQINWLQFTYLLKIMSANVLTYLIQNPFVLLKTNLADVAAAVVVFKWDRVVSLVTDVGQNIGCSEGA